MKSLEYNHVDLSLVDLRYRGNDEKGYYILSFQTASKKKIYPVNINKSIFETVLYKYFTPLFTYTREDLFKLRWCAYLTEGKYYQYKSLRDSDQPGEYVEVKASDPTRIYVSRLDIMGDLHALTYSDTNE